MHIEQIEQILRENPNFDLIWIPSNEKQHKVLLNRLEKQSIACLFRNQAMMERAKEKTGFVRGIILIGEADNRLSNAEQRASAPIVVEKNVSAHKFDCLCNQLSDDLIGRFFC